MYFCEIHGNISTDVEIVPGVLNSNETNYQREKTTEERMTFMGIFDLFRGRKKVSLPQEPETDRSADSFPHTEKSWETQKGSNSLPFSISVSLSRVSVQEDGVEDLYAGGDSLSNEQIAKGDRILDTYLVTSDAIKGGMGSIWKVHHSSWDTDLAMKRPQPRFFSEASTERKQHFIHECEAWIGLGLHPNIVSC